jgi:hypothetical protein
VCMQVLSASTNADMCAFAACVGKRDSQLHQLHPGTQSFGHVAFPSRHEPPRPSSPGLLCSLCSLGIYPCHLSSRLDRCRITKLLKKQIQLNEYRTESYLILCIQGKQYSSVGSCQVLSALLSSSFLHHGNHCK